MHYIQKGLLLSVVGISILSAQGLAAPLYRRSNDDTPLAVRSSNLFDGLPSDQGHWTRNIAIFEERSCADGDTGCTAATPSNPGRRSEPTVVMEERDSSDGCANSPTGCTPGPGKKRSARPAIIVNEERDNAAGCANSPTGCQSGPGRKRSLSSMSSLDKIRRNQSLPPGFATDVPIHPSDHNSKRTVPNSDDCHNSPTGCTPLHHHQRKRTPDDDCHNSPTGCRVSGGKGGRKRRSSNQGEPVEPLKPASAYTWLHPLPSRSTIPTTTTDGVNVSDGPTGFHRRETEAMNPLLATQTGEPIHAVKRDEIQNPNASYPWNQVLNVKT